MKKFLVFAMCILTITACKKEHKTSDVFKTTPEENLQSPPKCGNDINPEFAARMAKTSLSRDREEKVSERKPKESPAVAPARTVFFLDPDGHLVENTRWNWSRTFNCVDAGLAADQMSSIIKLASEDYSDYQVIITDDEDLYNNTPKDKRVRVIITHRQGLNDIFPNASGYAYIGSLWWEDDTPCFVFSDVLRKHTPDIAEIVSHEIGHTIGLYHQSEFYPDGALKNVYHSGFFIGDLTWRAIMGLGFNGNISGWMIGHTTTGTTQQDVQLLKAVGIRSDDGSDDISSANELKFSGNMKKISLNALINHSADADFYLVNGNDIKFSLTGGGNSDLKVVAYNHHRQVIAEFNDSYSINISEKNIKTKGGKIYLKVIANDLMPGVIESNGSYTLVVNKI